MVSSQNDRKGKIQNKYTTVTKCTINAALPRSHEMLMSPGLLNVYEMQLLWHSDVCVYWECQLHVAPLVAKSLVLLTV